MMLFGLPRRLVLLITLSALAVASAPAFPKTLTVAVDDNYPPYIFRNDRGEIEGYLPDLWQLWEKRTGTTVKLLATDWALAQKRLHSGEADVIDTIFRTPEREKLLEFSLPYAKLPVSIFAGRDLGGITRPEALRGFMVGAKEGDACVDKLRQAGVVNIQPYPSYTLVIDAAIAGEVRIFCLDDPPANYLLYKKGADKSFHQAFTLYSGEFHRAVKQENKALLGEIQKGFDAIPPEDIDQLRKKWFGTPLDLAPWGRYLAMGSLLLLVLGAGGTIAIYILRRAVKVRTEQLDNERVRLDTLIRTLPDLVWLKDMDGVYLSCNPRFEAFFGASESNIIGKTDADFVGKEMADIFRANDKRAAEANAPTINEEWVTFASDGHRELLETTKTPMRDATGRLIGILGIGHDITQRHQDEERLRLHALVLDQIQDHVTVTDLDGIVTYVNQAQKRALQSDHTGKHHSSFGNERAADATQLEIAAATMKAGHWQGMVVNPIADGGHIRVSLRTTLIRDHDGQPVAMVGVGTDITESMRAEAELSQHRDHLEQLVDTRTAELALAKDAAESASRAKSAFLANMSHELRTPMNGVMGMIDMAKRHMADPKGLDQLDKAKLSAERLLGVLNDILDISKIEAERMVFESVPLQISAVIENLTSTLGHKATEKGLQLETDLPADLMRQPLKGDPLRLGQILFNLVGNAIKFTPQGAVTLRVRQVADASPIAQSLPPLTQGVKEPDDTSPLSPRGRGAGGEGASPLPRGEREQRAPDATVLLRFDVIDTGIGISPEAQVRLFQSFEQADNSMTRKYGGTGLGLAISKRLVQLMGGEIGVDSAPGAGSTFWFVVPLKQRAPDAVLPAPTFTELSAGQRLQADYTGTRILLAEDEPITQEISRDLLEEVGFVVDIAEDGQQALALARQNRYALILMDMQMPHLNGIEAAQAIRTDSLNQTTPILAMTANAFDEDREACLAAGMDEHISKPVVPQRLYETLLAWLEKCGN